MAPHLLIDWWLVLGHQPLVVAEFVTAVGPMPVGGSLNADTDQSAAAASFSTLRICSSASALCARRASSRSSCADGNADQLRGVFSGSCAAHMPVMICHRPSVFFQVCVNLRQIPAPLRVPSPYSVTYSAAY